MALNSSTINSGAIGEEHRRTWARASEKAENLLKRMLDEPVPWKRPYGMEPPKLERSGLPSSVYAAGNVLVNFGNITGSQIQQGTTASRQTMTQDAIGATLNGVLDLVREARIEIDGKPALQAKVSPLANALEDAARENTPSLRAII